MSVSSLDGSPVPTDLAAKYQKIAAEYAKIRAQFGVLKKAVVDEQNHSAELKETLRLKDQNLRKAEQEIDSLHFRNQQLTKRVTILQDELDAAQNAVKKGKAKVQTRDIPNSILAEELQKKISENVELVTKLQEQTEKFEAERSKLVHIQEVCEHELEECKKKLVNVEETKLAKIESDSKQLLSKLQAKEEMLQKLNNEIKILKMKASERASEPDNSDWRQGLMILFQSLQVEELLQMIVTFFCNFEILYGKCMNDSTSEKFVKCIESNTVALGGFINSYSSYCINASVNEDLFLGFQQLCGSVNSYVILLDQLTLYMTSGKDEEINQIFKKIITSFKNHWMQFLSAMKMCLTCGTTSPDSEECATAFADVFRSLRSTCDYFSSSLSVKLKSMESGMEPDFEMLSTLSKIGVLSAGIYKKLTENKLLLRTALENRPARVKAKERDLNDECCHHWKEKYDAMNVAHAKKIKDLEEQISCLSGAATPRSCHSGNTVHSPLEGNEKLAEISNTFGVLTGPGLTLGSWENQESEIMKYFNARANALIADRQLAESKVTALKNECEALEKRLEHSLKCREMLESSVKQSQNTVARLQEELTTTTTNYEVQLSSLSEHMANMNDKLAAQQEEIEVLNYQLSEKGSKKGKSK